jgi:hypothetical protein
MRSSKHVPRGMSLSDDFYDVALVSEASVVEGGSYKKLVPNVTVHDFPDRTRRISGEGVDCMDHMVGIFDWTHFNTETVPNIQTNSIESTWRTLDALWKDLKYPLWACDQRKAELEATMSGVKSDKEAFARLLKEVSRLMMERNTLCALVRDLRRREETIERINSLGRDSEERNRLKKMVMELSMDVKSQIDDWVERVAWIHGTTFYYGHVIYVKKMRKDFPQ